METLHNKQSFFYRFFKPKFFQNCSILEALDSSGSYAWQNIVKGRDILKSGASWWVGYGDSISVWADSWLPSTVHPRAQSPIFGGFQDAKVSDLINPISKLNLGFGVN